MVMGMDDAQMGAMMGMSAGEHRQMMQQTQALRREVEELQTASLDAVRRRMPDHLRSIQQLLLVLERSADRMRHAS
jgi:hypothetical protein